MGISTHFEVHPVPLQMNSPVAEVSQDSQLSLTCSSQP